jgi:CelD/BcsL family acetyltransferase involved in cellulose biosynthesis
VCLALRQHSPVRAASATTVEAITDAERFAGLREEWNALLAGSAADNLFLTWEWLHTWWKHFSAGRRLSLLAVRREGELIALAPLAVGPRRIGRLVPFQSLEFLGTGSVGSDYLDLIVQPGHEEEAFATLARQLDGQKLAVAFAQLSRQSCLARGLAQRLVRRGWSCAEQRTDVCPVVALSGLSWPAYLATLDGHHRNSFKRRLRNLSGPFDVRLDRVTMERDRPAALATVIALHLMRWRERGGSTAFHAPSLIAFHEEFSRLAFERGWLRLLVLRLDDEPAAALYGFRYRDTFYFYQTGFDPRYAPYGVGQAIVGLSIKSALEEGARQYDFLHGDERYKFDWTREVRELSRIDIYPGGARGTLHRRTAELSGAARRTARRVLASTWPRAAVHQAARS